MPSAQSLSSPYAWLIGLAVVVLGLGALGWQDLLRLSPTRIGAIAAVVFRQAMRRRILWLSPVVMLGVVLVAHLARPMDVQDDIRQATKFYLFATGMLVVLLTIILACTNLPKEVETRVIYTVATKPVTRLEIILGKIVGFSQISAALLLVMAVMGLGFLMVREARLQRQVTQRLSRTVTLDTQTRRTLERYRDAGLLHARQYVSPGGSGIPQPYSLQTYSGGRVDWASPELDILAPFTNPAGMIPESSSPTDEVLVLQATIDSRPIPGSPAATAATTLPAAPRRVNLEILDVRQEYVAGYPVMRWLGGQTGPAKPSSFSLTESGELGVAISAEVLPKLREAGQNIYIRVVGQDPDFEYSLKSMQLRVRGSGQVMEPLGPALYRSRTGSLTQQLRGGQPGMVPVAMYRYAQACFTPSADGSVEFELRATIERSGGGRSLRQEEPTVVHLTFIPANGAKPYTTQVMPESNRPVYMRVPASALGDGSFAVSLSCPTAGHWLSLRSGPNASLRLIAWSGSFAWNLLKGLAVLWLMSVLVACASVFCSTFVSWPIAVLLTAFILMGRWGVEQVGEVGEPRSVVSDLFGKRIRPAEAHALTESLRGLNHALRLTASVLPDITQYSAVDRLESGSVVPAANLWQALRVTLGFGLPLLVLGFVFLKYKEVAP